MSEESNKVPKSRHMTGKIVAFTTGTSLVASELIVASNLHLKPEGQGIANYVALLGIVVTGIASFPHIAQGGSPSPSEVVPHEPVLPPDGPTFGAEKDGAWVQLVKDYMNGQTISV